MACSHCGSRAALDSQYCPACGKLNDGAGAAGASSPALLIRSGSKPKWRAAAFLRAHGVAAVLIVLLLIACGAVLLLAFSPRYYSAAQTGGGLAMFSGPVFAYLFKRAGSSAWAGLATGIVAAFLVSALGSLIHVLKHTPARPSRTQAVRVLPALQNKVCGVCWVWGAQKNAISPFAAAGRHRRTGEKGSSRHVEAAANKVHQELIRRQPGRAP